MVEHDYSKLMEIPEVGKTLCDEQALPLNAYIDAALEARLQKEKYITAEHFEAEKRGQLAKAIDSALNPILKKNGFAPIPQTEAEIGAFAMGFAAYLFKNRQK